MPKLSVFILLHTFCYALFTVNHQTPTRRKASLCQEIIPQERVALQTLESLLAGKVENVKKLSVIFHEGQKGEIDEAGVWKKCCFEENHLYHKLLLLFIVLTLLEWLRERECKSSCD